MKLLNFITNLFRKKAKLPKNGSQEQYLGFLKYKGTPVALHPEDCLHLYQYKDGGLYVSNYSWKNNLNIAAPRIEVDSWEGRGGRMIITDKDGKKRLLPIS